MLRRSPALRYSQLKNSEIYRSNEDPRFSQSTDGSHDLAVHGQSVVIYRKLFYLKFYLKSACSYDLVSLRAML